MILFKNDWQRYPQAVVHTETQNKSFLEMALKLKAMGIQNHLWMLQLHDARLRNVDPYDPNLSVEQMALIAIECKVNPFYFFRELARAPATAGIEPSKVGANRANLALWWSFFNHITFILTQPRQTGKSFCTDLLMTSLLNFQCSNTKINLLTKDDGLRVANVQRLKEIYDELPRYLNFKTKADANNTEMITINRFNNQYNTHVPQSSPKGAYKVGRGLTTPIFHMDEPPFQPNIDIAMPSAFGAMGANIDRARELNEPYGIILTTTAGKRDDPSGKYIYNYIQDGALWSERFYDAADEESLRKLICTNSRKGAYRVYASFTYKQLGKSDQWMKEQLERTSGTPDDANRDYFNIWTSGTESSPLPVQITETLNKSIVTEKYHQIFPTGGYILRWYLHENAIAHYLQNHQSVIGIDTSDASGGDDISFVMTDVETGGTICTATFNETNLIMFAQWLVTILEMMPHATMIIERRSSAVTIIDYLLMFLPQRGIDPFQRLFNWIVHEPMEHAALYDEVRLPMRRRKEDLYVRAKKYFGFATSGSGQTSRSELYSTTLINACRRCAELIRDRALTEQITGLIIKNGRIDHQDGGHDDLVIGFLLTHWLLTMGKNLMHYGIDVKHILVEHKVKTEVKAEDMYFLMEQQQLREKIEQVYQRLTQEQDPFVLKRLEHELRFLDSKLILEDGEVFSVDSVLQELNQKRKTLKTQQLNAHRHAY